MDSNFTALAAFDPQLAAPGQEAERAFSKDPRAAMGHLRRFGEVITHALMEHYRLHVYATNQFERLRALGDDTSMEREILSQLHQLRKIGNQAVHAYGRASLSDAMRMLKCATQVARWFWQNCTPQHPPKPGPFVCPTANTRREDRALIRARKQAEAEVARTKDELEKMQRLLDMPQVSFWHGLEESFHALPEADHGVVGTFLDDFRTEPIHEDWPLVPMTDVHDDKAHTVAVGEHRLVVVKAPRGDLLLVAFVGTEAQATQWARHRRFEVHPTVGTLQVYDLAEAEAASTGAGGLFATHSDDDLNTVGVPTPLLVAVRSLDSRDALDALVPHLPPEAADGLALLADGKTAMEALDILTRVLPDEVDAEDFAVAVHHPDSQRSFKLIEAPEDLEEVLRGDIERWRVYLHPDQRRLVRMNANGPVRVLGGAGTGKTVALLHRASFLVSEVFTEPGERILVTTFTRNLASDLQHNLAKLMSEEQLARVDVTNLDAIAGDLWRAHGDGRSLATSLKRHWTAAMADETLDLDESFYEAEWTEVIQRYGITDERAYLRARRTGRGAGLSRSQRVAVWAVLGTFQRSLADAKQIEASQRMRLLTEGLQAGEIPRAWSTALVDEVQDFDAVRLQFVRALVARGPHDLFLVGDAHQRLYARPVPMGRCGIEIRGRARRLRVNYRTTARVRTWAVRALDGQSVDDLDGGVDNLEGYRSIRLGEPPTVDLLPTRQQELDHIQATLASWLEEVSAEEICIAAPTKDLVATLERTLTAAGHTVHRLTSKASAVGDGVRIGTFHRLKGLEFPRVLLTSVNDGDMPLRPRSWHEQDADEQARRDHQQRCLLYVAATRARDLLAVSGSGTASPFFTETV